jgi:hypothetical protein
MPDHVSQDRDGIVREAPGQADRMTETPAQPNVAAMLALQRTAGNQAAVHAVRALGGSSSRRLMRQFATLGADLAPKASDPARKYTMKVMVDEAARLDGIWKKHMTGISPKDFVVGVLQGLPELVPGHDRVYVNFEPKGDAAILFEIKLQETRASKTKPEGGEHKKDWVQMGEGSWFRSLAGATRVLTFGDQVLQVLDHRTDAPTGTAGGSGFTKQLFKNLLRVYAKAGKAQTVLELSADEQGRYVWARYGFLPDAEEWRWKIRDTIVSKVRTDWAKRRGLTNVSAKRPPKVRGHTPFASLAEKLAECAQAQGTPITDQDAAAMAAALTRDDPAALFALMDIPGARAQKFLWWLFASGPVAIWKGRLDLNDPVQGPRLREYINRPTPKLASAQPTGAPQSQSAEALAVGSSSKQ